MKWAATDLAYLAGFIDGVTWQQELHLPAVPVAPPLTFDHRDKSGDVH